MKVTIIEELTEDYIVFTTDKEETFTIRGGYFVHFEKHFENHLLDVCDGCVNTQKYILSMGLEKFNEIQDLVGNLNQFIVDNPYFISEYGVTKVK